MPLPLTGLTQQMFRAAIAKGHGEEDICSTIKVLEEIVGVDGREKITGNLQISVAFLIFIYYYWNQAGEATPTKARLTS